MRFALLMAGGFFAVLGAAWVFIFIALWYGAICLEKAVVEAMRKWWR